MDTPEAFAPPTRCSGCGTDLAPGLLACPACHRLVHASELRRLADDADRATREGRTLDALASWRQALEWLPPDSRQSRTIGDKVAELSRHVDTTRATGVAGGQTAARRPAWAARAGVLGALGLLLWKLKFVAVFVLSKAKLLAAGLTKGGTFLSMLAALGVYWAAWGWKFAAGLIAAIYVHEMGHVAALRRFGIPASAPMFVPGLGAFVRMRNVHISPIEEARVGLAGPIWGLGATLVCYGIFLASGAPLWAAFTQWSARINLFNLIPVRPLDGGRGCAGLSRGQMWLAVAAIAIALFTTHEGLLWLLLIVGGLRALAHRGEAAGDRVAAAQYALLVLALAALTLVPVRL